MGKTKRIHGGLAVLAVACVVGALLAVLGATLAVGREGEEVQSGASSTSTLFAAQIEVLERDGLSPVQAGRELELQNLIDEVKLIPLLEAALEEEFGGVWLEPEAATLHVAVTSAAGRAVAEEVAERAGLSGHVVEDQVPASWSELITARESWGRHHADLLSRSEATISLRPQTNSIKVQLSPAVGRSERSALKDEASAYRVPVDLVVSQARAQRLTPQLRCAEFKASDANCDPPIVAGITIKNDNSELCTAGPAVIKKNVDDDTTETFILTAGHCATNNANEPFDGYKKNGTEDEFIGRTELALTRFNDVVDIAAVKIENPYWTNVGLTPVSPAVASWMAGSESEVFSVAGQQGPVINHTTCHSGQKTGTHCGRIEEVGITSEGRKETVEVREMSVETEEGDSGGPWFSPLEPTGLMMEGTHVSGAEGFNRAYFIPLKFSLERLASYGDQYEYVLLTTANKLRPNCPMPSMPCFMADSYPATITGSQLETSSFGTESGKVECSSGSYSGTLAEDSETLELLPSYGTCSVFGTPLANVDVNECKYKFKVTSKVEKDKFKGTVDIACPTGKTLTITSICGCSVTIGSQTALGTIEYSDTTSASPKKDLDVKTTITGLKYTESSACLHPGTRSTGTFSGQATLKADSGTTAEGFRLAG